MYGFCRLGTIPCAVRRRRLDVERARDEAEHEGEEDGDEPEDGHRPRDELARAAVEPDREPGVAREHEQPEQERALLASPERGKRVAERQLVARVLPDVDEGHVAAAERDEQDDRRRRASPGTPRAARSAPTARAGGAASTRRTSRRRARRATRPKARRSAARPSGAIATSRGLRRRVLRRALRHERAVLRDEDTVPQRSRRRRCRGPS